MGGEGVGKVWQQIGFSYVISMSWGRDEWDRDGEMKVMDGGGLSLADDGFSVVAGDIVVLDSVVVEIVEDGKTKLVALPVVRLGSVGTTGVGPLVGGGGSSGGPSDGGVAAVVNVSTGPEVLLSLPGYKT